MHYILLAVLGFFTGVVLNLVADALPAGRHPFTWPRCRACGRSLGARALAGLAADLAGWSRCSACGARRALRAPLVEAGTAVVFVLLATRFAGWQLATMCVYFSAFILITVTDLEHRLIFDVVTLSATALALAGSLTFPRVGIVRSAIGAAVGFGVFLLLALAARKKEGLGGGDVTLAGFMGAATGFPNVIVALVAAIFAGGIGAAALLITRRARRTSYVPYGPFLVVGAVIALLAGQQVVQWYVNRLSGS